MIADVGDYTGDATSGLLWRDTAGEFHGRGDDPRHTVSLWEMNGPNVVA
jgi:hypothetical protein